MLTSQRISRPALGIPQRLLLAISLLCPAAVLAQGPAGPGASGTSLPDSPRPKQQAPPTSSPGATSKFIGYVSNKSFVFPDLANSPNPLSTGRKFELFVNQSISPPYVLAAGFNAAVSQARDVPSSYGQGWDAYGSRYGAAMARASSDSFFSTFLIASVLHQDPRFYPQSHPTFWGSVKYSTKRIFVTWTDSEKDTFNTSGILGPLAAETLANSYLPRTEQTGAKTAERYGTDMAWKFAANMFKNYWPAIFRSVRLNHLKVIPNPGPSDNPPPQSKD